ncbi:leucine-rich repeat receptor protein kinase HPCA1-like [Argentina anserina]|uniref:leucine-rich repeat receptor protein kinase HPCA1-like n=1 Tax=Argentina anserina TaxID=57926 RepID=UPI0021768D80|nr:leucine-rich repeat receptor protein kinase HPCA1-like [Potentilla anserina]
MGLIGELFTGYIGQLSELTTVDVSHNPGLTGQISKHISSLRKLLILDLAGCSFSGCIPDSLGALEQLTYIDMSSNNLSGIIPSALGQLSNLYLLDLSDNQLTGPLPISSHTTHGGLDLLLKAQHLFLYNNQLSGSIPPELFSSAMSLASLFLDGNHFTGVIPMTLGLVKTLQAVRLADNSLTGTVPSNLNNLTNVFDLNLGKNKLTGSLPDLTAMKSLIYVDLSDNSFDPSEAPLWFSTLPRLDTLNMECGSLQGVVPENLFSLPELQQVNLKNNMFNGLNMGNNISRQLKLVDLECNHISELTIEEKYKGELILKGNPICSGSLSNSTWCQ